MLGLKRGSNLLMVELKEGITVAIPTVKALANIKVLDVQEDGVFTAHWTSNFNTDGDFRTELMVFTSDLVLDTEDLAKRNAVRVENGLMPIE